MFIRLEVEPVVNGGSSRIFLSTTMANNLIEDDQCVDR